MGQIMKTLEGGLGSQTEESLLTRGRQMREERERNLLANRVCDNLLKVETLLEQIIDRSHSQRLVEEAEDSLDCSEDALTAATRVLALTHGGGRAK